MGDIDYGGPYGWAMGAITLVVTAIGTWIALWYKNTPNRIKELKARTDLENAQLALAQANIEHLKLEWQTEMEKMETRYKTYLTESTARVQEVKREVAAVKEELHKCHEGHLDCIKKSAFFEGKLDAIEKMQKITHERMNAVESKATGKIEDNGDSTKVNEVKIKAENVQVLESPET